MGNNKRKCIVDGKLGIVTETYTHTVDVYLFKAKRVMYGVHKKYVHLQPLEAPKIDGAQLSFNYET